MIVVTNRIPVAEGHQIDFEDRFKRRVHLVDQAPGFVRNEVHLVLYGDNAPDGRAIGPVEELEWALLEAGLAMERDLLEERLRAFERARGYRP